MKPRASSRILAGVKLLFRKTRLPIFFAISSAPFTFAFRHDAAVTAPTELFVPNYQYPRGYVVEVSDGTTEIDREHQVLRYHPTPPTTTCDIHTIRLTGKR